MIKGEGPIKGHINSILNPPLVVLVMFFTVTEAKQNTFKACVYCCSQVHPKDLNNGVINGCFLLLFKDLIKMYACYNDGIINLLGKGSQLLEYVKCYYNMAKQMLLNLSRKVFPNEEKPM